MKRMIVCLLIMAFVLAGCQSAASGNTDPNTLGSAPTQTQDTTPTVPSTDPTVKPTEPTVKPTEPTVKPTEPTVKPTEPTVPPTEPTPTVDPEREKAKEAIQYALPPDNLYPFIYDGDPPSTWREIDATDCVIGRLYVFNEDTKSVTAVGTDTVVTFATTKDHLFYVTDTQKIIQTDYSGSFFREIYQVEEGSITANSVNTFGHYLYFVENENKVVVWDSLAGKIHVALDVDYTYGALMCSFNEVMWFVDERLGYYYDYATGQIGEVTDEMLAYPFG